jgi:hypothetical protein
MDYVVLEFDVRLDADRMLAGSATVTVGADLAKSQTFPFPCRDLLAPD